jgi:hypothetical protein
MCTSTRALVAGTVALGIFLIISTYQTAPSTSTVLEEAFGDA